MSLISEKKEIIEWAILMGLFKATLEQQSMLIDAKSNAQLIKKLYNEWNAKGDRLFKLISRHIPEKRIEGVTDFIENAVHEIRAINTDEI